MNRWPAALVVWCGLCAVTMAAQNIIVVFDDSGSMETRMRSNPNVRKIDAAKQALAVVLDQLPSDAQIGVLGLNSGWVIPFQRVNATGLSDQVSRLRAEGGTPLGVMLKNGGEALLAARQQQSYGDYRLLVLTDGEANDQSYLESILPDLMSRGVMLDVIGVDMEADHSLATKVHAYRRADDPGALQQAIADALAESDVRDDGEESDFELLAAFPAELAPITLAALCEPNNQPLQATDLPADYAPRAPLSPVPTAGGGWDFGVGLVVLIGAMIAVVSLLSTLLRAATRR